MATARVIIRGALTFYLNRLSPGEAEDADLFDRCLDGLNDIVDEVNGGKSMLARDLFSTGTVTSATGTLGTTWSALNPGDKIVSASWVRAADDEVMLSPLTMAQYHAVADKSQAGDPQYYCHDGLATVYFLPVPTSASVKLLTHAEVADFADLDTSYSMPKGWQSGLTAMLAERMAPALLGGVTPAIASAAGVARNRLNAQASRPAIIGARRFGGNILNDGG
jgi:hypothetical protein